MRKIEQIAALPDWEWHEHSAKEMAEVGAEWIFNSDSIWRIGNAVVAGFEFYNLLCPPWMWFILSKNVTVGDLTDFRRICKFIPRGTTTSVQEGYEKGSRFAELYGFEFTNKYIEVNSSIHKLYRRK